MLDNHAHLSDREILLVMDGETSSHNVVRVRKHLAACWKCRVRVGEIEGTISHLVRSSRDLCPLPAADGPRALLKARLSEIVGTVRTRRRLRLFRSRFGVRGPAYACAIFSLLGLAAAGWLVHRHSSQREFGPIFSEAESASIPIPSLTPGAVRPVAISDVCGARRGETVRAVPVAIQRRVFQEYGMPNALPSDYEVDYLITPELGGVDDIRNLWPEPHSATVWNSYVKDQLETYLHQQVCAGKLNLKTAQRDIATDWISAYKRYFHVDQPRSNYAAPNLGDQRGPTT